MMRYIKLLIAFVWILSTAFGVIAQDDEEEPTIPYYQSSAFNVPILDGWENQSTDDFAQFYNPEMLATIRTHVVNSDDAIAGAKQDLETFLETDIDDPIYNEKVNLADGTWAVLVYEVDEDTIASAMARHQEGKVYVVSFIESHPDASIIMATIAHTNDTEDDDPTPEMATMVDTFTSANSNDLSVPEAMILASGEWTSQSVDDIQVLGWVFGNDSYLALADGTIDNLPELANAYNTTLLGFFVTPDNSDFLALGLFISLGTLALLAFSIMWRSRNLQKDLAVIQQLVEDD